ncbi:MAG: adenylate/guanylate cyclase domain-containing protein, partial [Hyphomicrobiaceae bacterium]
MAFPTPQIDVDLQVRTELKEVTVLFADIENSTRLIESMDPERASAALDPIIGIMVETVRSFGGTVARIVGDGIMAIFGAPVSLEGHAVQACFAGLEITEKVKKRSLIADDKINIRVGIDSGQVLVRTYGTDLSVSYDAVGLIVHMASKIEKLAATNTVALSRRTEQQARGFISTVSVSHVALNHANHEVLKLTGRALPGKSMARNCRTLCDLVNHTECFEQLRAAEATLFDGRGCSVMLEG